MFSGCSTTGSKNAVVIDRSNGINIEEATEIATQALNKSSKLSEYKVKTAKVLKTLPAKDYSDYWFVSFDPKSFDQSFWRYLVVMKKDTGEVVHSEPYVPLEIIDYDWVFEK